MDCLDGSDEAECAATSPAPPAAPGPAAPGPSAPPPRECPAPALACDNRTRCVPLHLQCDGNADCDDNADEADRCGDYRFASNLIIL